ncbi:MAG: PorT family protein [Cyclobacteriaceae bacterium]|nr:PorT family protein [Cyclobacteriaceae bacterium]
MQKYLFTSLILFISICAGAQTLTVIPKVGATLSTVSSEFDEDTKSKPGFTLGGAVNYKVNELFSVQAELNFIQKGYREKGSMVSSFAIDGYLFTNENSFKRSTNLNHLEIPVLARLSFGNNTKFFVHAGPSVSFILSGKSSYESSETETIENLQFDDEIEVNTHHYNEKYKIDLSEPIYKRIDFGLQLGAGAIIADKILVEARYGLGLSNLYNMESYKVTNRVFQLTVGIPILLK